MRRDHHRVSLDGAWDFLINPDDTSDATPLGEWRSTIVPMPWQAQFEDLRNTSGVAWHRRHFTVEQDFFRSAENTAILHFGAVDYYAIVWLNGKRVGEHEGGYLPFEFEIIDLLHEGDNELLIKVVDATDDRQRYADFPFSEVPHGKQSWYGPIGGIWQSVWLELRPKLHIAQVGLNPLPGDAAIGVHIAGLPSWVQRNHSWAGLVVGWLHKSVSLLTVMPYGHGHILITTFKLNETTLARDAIAQALFAGMLNLF